MKKTLEKICARLLPAVARRVCARVGLDQTVLSDRENGFDLTHYEQSAGRRFASASAALLHYVTVGSYHGLQPRAGFDPGEYLRRNPDVAAIGYEPFAHYYRFGREEGRGTASKEGGPDHDPISPPDISKMLLRPRPPADAVKVDIVMPVYGSRSLTLQAIDSVLAATTKIPYELVVIDDASPDPVLRHELQTLASAGLLTLLGNERNLGFVETANRGFALHDDRDVVLLNSDTKVFGEWLDRLMKVMNGTTRTATVSPLSNAATILSYPVTLRDNNRLCGMDLAVLDHLCALLDLPPVALPTAVGFCMAIKRTCLREVGPFDSQKFWRGYGEENDFSLRATLSGWQHMAATNVFVWHRGGASFGVEREALIEAAQQTLELLHPGYAALVQSFIRLDPLGPVRAALDAARVRADSRRKVLHVAPATSSFEEKALRLMLIPDIAPLGDFYRVCASAFPPAPNLPRIRRDAAVEDWAQMMRELDIREVDISASMAGTVPVRDIEEAARSAGIDFKIR